MDKEVLYNVLLALAVVLSAASLISQYCTHRACKRTIRERDSARAELADTVRELSLELRKHNTKIREYGTISPVR
jgi:hypothetical protein